MCAFACLSLGVASAPFAASRIDQSKAPVCAKGRRSTAQKPCKVVKKSPSTTKYVPTAVCGAGQKSTAAKPCITLADNGPPPTIEGPLPASQSPPTPISNKPSTTTPANITPAPKLSGPHITAHTCQAPNGIVFECQAIDGNLSVANYPEISG
jgi:hypothetical protein